MILRRSTLLSQPQGPAEVDWYNPVTRGLIAASNGRDGTHGLNLSAIPKGLSKSGTVLVAPGASGYRVPLRSSVTSSEWTLFSRGSIPGTNYQAIFGLYGSSSEFISQMPRIFPSNAFGTDARPYAVDSSSGSFLSVGNEFTITTVISASSNVIEHYINGALVSSASLSSTSQITVNSIEVFTKNLTQDRAQAGATIGTFAAFNRALTAKEVGALSANPWQLFRPVQRRIYFDMDSIAPPLDHILTAESAVQQILSQVGSVSQENTLAGGISVQSAVSSGGVIQQINTLIGENSFSNNLSAVAALTQLNTLQGNNQQTINLSSDSSISQIHNLSALSTAVEIISSSAGILQSNILLASSCLVPNYSTSGSIALVPVTDLSGNSVSQYDLSSSSNLQQVHVLAEDASEQDVLSSSGVAVQTHVLISDSSTQIVLSSSGAISTSGSLLGNNAQQTNTSPSGFIIQASFLQGNVVKQVNLSSSGAITQGGVLPPLTDGELREILASMQSAIARLQVRLDAMY